MQRGKIEGHMTAWKIREGMCVLTDFFTKYMAAAPHRFSVCLREVLTMTILSIAIFPFSFSSPIGNFMSISVTFSLAKDKWI